MHTYLPLRRLLCKLKLLVFNELKKKTKITIFPAFFKKKQDISIFINTYPQNPQISYLLKNWNEDFEELKRRKLSYNHLKLNLDLFTFKLP